MDYIFLIVSSIIVLTCFYFVFSPFLSPRAEGIMEKENGEDKLTLESIYQAVNELEMDYLMKKLNEEDYLNLKEQYQVLAAGMLNQNDKQRKNPAKKNKATEKVELEILEELQKIRKQRGR